VAQQKQVRVATAVVAGIIILLNLFLVWTAVNDGGWGALGIAIMFGPMANLAGIIGALILARFVREGCPGADLTFYYLASILLPIVAVAVDFVIISSLPLHGC
jgi:hypothetical protein